MTHFYTKLYRNNPKTELDYEGLCEFGIDPLKGIIARKSATIGEIGYFHMQGKDYIKN